MNLEYVESSYEMLMLRFVYHSDFFGIFAFVSVVVEVVRGGGQFIIRGSKLGRHFSYLTPGRIPTSSTPKPLLGLCLKF